MIRFNSIILISCIVFWSCQQHDGNDIEIKEHTLYVVHGDNSKGYISSLKTSEDFTTQVAEVVGEPYLIDRMDNDLYIHSFPDAEPYNHVEVFSIPSFSLKNVGQYSDFITGAGPTEMIVHGEQIIAADFDYGQGKAFLRFIKTADLKQIDTVHVRSSIRVQDLLIANNRLYISFRDKIKEFSISPFEELRALDIPVSPSNNLLLDSDKNALMYNGTLYKLNTEGEMSLTKLSEPNSHYIKPAINTDRNCMYIITAYAQPAPVPYGLRKLNVETGHETDIITDFNPVLNFDIDFITYHSASGLIVVGGTDFVSGQGILKLFTEDAELKQTYILSTRPIGVL